MFQVFLWVFKNKISSPEEWQARRRQCPKQSRARARGADAVEGTGWIWVRLCSWMFQRIRKKSTAQRVPCLSHGLQLFAPKHSNRGLNECVGLASVVQTCLIGSQMSVTDHFCHRDNPASPCSLVYCWLCSCFPSRSGAPDDGRPRYGLCSFSTPLSVFSCFVAAFKPSLQRMGKCLRIVWLRIQYITFVHFFSSCVPSPLYLLVWFSVWSFGFFVFCSFFAL